MRRFVFLLFGILVFSASLYSGDVNRLDQPIVIYENGFTAGGTHFWASGGAGVANPNQAEALLYNPALPVKAKYTVLTGGMRQFEKHFFFVQNLQVETGGKWLLPSYVLFAQRFKSGLLFLGYQNVYDFKKKFKTEIVTMEHPEGTGEFITDSEEQTSQNFFVGFNRQIVTQLSLGVKVGLLHHHLSGEIGQNKIDSEVGYSYAFDLGLHYKVGNQGQIALSYRYFNPLNYTFKINSPLFSNNGDSIQWVTQTIERPFRLPWFLELGVYFQPFKHWQAMLKVEYQEWKKVSKYYDNRLQLALGATFSPDNKPWKLNFGAFTRGHYPEQDYGIEDTPFVTAGVDYQFKPGLIVSLSALSNTFFVKKVNDHTKQIDCSQFLFGLQWTFN